MKFRIIKNARFMFWAHGMVFWPWVLLRPSKHGARGDEIIFKHELQRVYQVERYGRVMFLLRYLWGWVRGGFSYKRHPMEVEARTKQELPLTELEQQWQQSGRIRL